MTIKATSRLKLGPLHELLLAACPKKGSAPGSIPGTLAPALGVSYQYIYRWIDDGRVPAKYVKKLVEVSKGLVTVEQLIVFVI